MSLDSLVDSVLGNPKLDIRAERQKAAQSKCHTDYEAALMNARGRIAQNIGTSADIELVRRHEADEAAEAAEQAPPCWQPFPIGVLPEPIRGYIVALSKAMGCDESYVALPLLAVMAAAIGNSIVIRLKRSWAEACIIWAAIVGESGSMKSPPLRHVLRLVHRLQAAAMKRYAEAVRNYPQLLAEYEKEHREWEKSKDGDEPEKPAEPIAERYIVNDTTVEALAPILRDNPRGLLLGRDELAGWFGSFDQYKGGAASADSAHWLSMFNGEVMIVDRRKGVPPLIYIPRASVSITGSIQPDILSKVLAREHRESGLAARLVFASPPRQPKRWTEADIDEGIEAAVAQVLDRLYSLEIRLDEDGTPQPIALNLNRSAKQAWIRYFNEHGLEQAELSGDLAAAWSKLEGYSARFALVVHCIRWAAGDTPQSSLGPVDAKSIEAGVMLSRWFGNEAKRIYATFDESDEDRDRRRLVEWIQSRGGSVTARDLQMGMKMYRGPGLAEAALEQLAKANLGKWEPTPAGQNGRPTRHFRLSTSSTVHATPVTPEKTNGFVDVDRVDEFQAESDEDAANREFQKSANDDEDSVWIA